MLVTVHVKSSHTFVRHTARQISASNFRVSPRRIIVITLLLLSAASAISCSAHHNQAPVAGQPASAEQAHVRSVPDFGKVNDFLYRGGDGGKT
jgi:hypothetical protein